MAKRGTLDHPKTLSLARALKVEAWSALGLLEAFWHWTGRYRPTGNLTGVKPKDLADGVRARRNPEKLLSVLVQERWIDRVGDALYVHDWPDHADDATKKSLMRSGREFDPYYQTLSRLGTQTESRPCLDGVATESASRAHAQEGKARQGKALSLDFEERKTTREGLSVSRIDETVDQFKEFRKEAEAAGMSGSEPDWREALMEWRHLDLEQRSCAALGVRERAGNGESAELSALPKNYLAKRMWQRKIRRSLKNTQSSITTYEKRQEEVHRLFRERMEPHAPKIQPD
jgi:hypothetical protein